MRVLVLAQEYPFEGDWKGLWAQNQARVLARCHQVVVVAPIQGERDRLERVEDEAGLPVIRSCYRQRRKSWWFSYLASVWRGYRTGAAMGRVDLIHAHMGTRAGWAAVVLGQLLGIPVVVTEHWGTVAERAEGSGSAARALRYAIRNAGAWVAVSEALASEIDALQLRPPVPVIGNVMHPCYYDAPAPLPESPPYRALSVGRMDNRAKGWEVLLEGMRETQGVETTLTLIGDGPARSVLEGRARELGLAGRCRFTGWLPPEQVRREIGAAHCFASASEYETFGLAFLEALACGRPVVGLAVGALPETIPAWAGTLVDDPGRLGEAVAGVCRALPDYDSKRLAYYAQGFCSRERFLEQINALYGRVAQESRSSSRGRAPVAGAPRA